MGCPTVMIGSGGGGGGGGSSPSANTAAAAEALKAGDVSPVEGTETFPIEIQAAILEMAKYVQPEEIKLKIEVISEALENGRGSEREKEEPVKLTLADFVEILEAVESEESYEAARFFAAYLDYGKLTEMARDYVTGADDDANNDPNKMPTRFMILYGADDNKLQQIDDHPDAFEGEEHKINVTNLRKGLKLLGYEVAEEGPYDDEVYRAHLHYLSTVPMGDPAAFDELEEDDGEMKYTVKDGEDLGTIVQKFGLPSWKYLYELNKGAIGKNPDLLQGGTKLSIPMWDSTGGDEKIEEKGGKAFKYTGGLRYRYPWVAFSTTLAQNKEALEEFDHERELVVRLKTTGQVLHKGTIKKTDDINLLIPECEDFMIGIKGMPLNVKGKVHQHPDDELQAEPVQPVGNEEYMDDES